MGFARADALAPGQQQRDKMKRCPPRLRQLRTRVPRSVPMLTAGHAARTGHEATAVQDRCSGTTSG